MASRNPTRNASGYTDLTAFYAIRNADKSTDKNRMRGGREPKSKPQVIKQAVKPPKANIQPKGNPSKKDYPRIYICSPYSGDTERNAANATRYSRFALKMRTFPIAPHLFLPNFMNDELPAERELALSFGLRLLYGCKEVWVFGDRISSGMEAEIAAAKRKRITVRYFNANCVEIKNREEISNE